jgi:tRNA(Ile)-lysidine synthase
MLETILLNQCGLDPAKPVLAGISGGPDSLCLLGILQEAGYRVIVAHFNHQLRSEAELEAASVSERAKRLGLPFVGDSADVQRYAREQSLSLEEAARILRYRFLFTAAHKHAAQAVAVGHTADDQVETVLMHFLRGAGLSGLKGMEYSTFLPTFDTEIPLVRPLLALWRRETESYCREHDLEPHFDASNSDTAYFRNRLRHELLPELEKYNPRFKESIWRTAQALQSDYSALQEGLESAWKDVFIDKGEAWMAFDRPGLIKLARGLRRNLIRRAAESLRPDSRDFGFDALERAAAFAEAPAVKRIDFVNGLYLFAEKGRIYLASYEAELPFTQWPQVSQPIAISHQHLDLGKGWILIKEESPLNTEGWSLSSDNWSAWLDADQFPSDSLVIRPCRAGDAFAPLGMAGQTIKLKDSISISKSPDGHAYNGHWSVRESRLSGWWDTGLRTHSASRKRPNTYCTWKLKNSRSPESSGSPATPHSQLSAFIRPRELPQFQMNFPPLDFRDAQFLADFIRLDVVQVILQNTSPTAHIEGQVFRQTGILADIFEQVFQPARRPG